MATIIVRRPRRERMEEQPPEELLMSRDGAPPQPKGAWDPTLPSELEGLIPAEEWAQIVDRLDEYWVPLFKRESEIESCAACLCCCCCCTLGISLCAMCCYSSCANRGLDKRKKHVRREMKTYFNDELNPRYADKGIHFAVSPTVKTFYVEIRLDDKLNPGRRASKARPGSSAHSTTDEEKEEEPLLRRGKAPAGDSAGAPSGGVAPAAPPAYGSTAEQQEEKEAVEPPAPSSGADDGLDGLD